MILKGSQRGGAKQLAQHLMNDHDNDHITIHAINGFIANDVEGALTEIHAISKATNCKQFMFSLSLSPPEQAVATIEDYENAVEESAERLGLADQPHVILFHEKNGRKHCHAVFSRIDSNEMKAINLPFYKERLNELAKELYLMHGWDLPKGFQDRSLSDPLNYTLEEYQVAKRAKRDPREIKAVLKECWQQSDGKKAFVSTLQDKGFYLCKGDKRGFVALDWQGNIYSLSRWTGEKTKALKSRLGEPEQYLSVEETLQKINQMMKGKYHQFKSELENNFNRKALALKKQRDRLVNRQRIERKNLQKEQQTRQIAEAIERSKRLRKGILGLWDWVSGKRRKIIKRNAAELEANQRRDELEQLQLSQRHLLEQQKFQSKIQKLAQKREYIFACLSDELNRWLASERERVVPDRSSCVSQREYINS